MKVYKPNPATGKMEVFESNPQEDLNYHVPPRYQTEGGRQSIGKPFPSQELSDNRRNRTYDFRESVEPIIPRRNRTYDFRESVEPIIPERNKTYLNPNRNFVDVVIDYDKDLFGPEEINGKGSENELEKTLINAEENLIKEVVNQLSFNDAFKQAREQGLRIFEWNGNVYNTRLKEETLSEKDSLRKEWDNSSQEMKSEWNNDFEKWFGFVTHKAGDTSPSTNVTLGGVDWEKQQYEVIGSDDKIIIYNFGEGPLPASYFEVKDELPIY